MPKEKKHLFIKFYSNKKKSGKRDTADILEKPGMLQDAILNNPNFAIVATDQNGLIQTFNSGAERMMGCKACDAVNKLNLVDFYFPEDLVLRTAALNEAFNMCLPQGFSTLSFKASRDIEDIHDMTCVCKDNTTFPLIASITALHNAQKDIIGYLFVGTDNTAHKNDQEAQKLLDIHLQDQQFYTRSLIEANNDAIIATDPFCIITDVNHQMELLTGCTRNELIGAPFKNFFTAPDLADIFIKETLNTNKVKDYELVVRGPEGKETVVSCNASTFHDRTRHLKGVFASAHDITNRKLLENKLKQEQKFKDALLENIMDAVVACDANGRLVLFNRIAREWHNLDVAASLPQEEWSSHYNLYHEDQKTLMKKDEIPLVRAFNGEIVENVNMVICTKGKACRQVVCSAVPIFDHASHKMGAITVMRDVTEQNKAKEKILQANQKLEKANMAKSDFLSSMSHELRSPLNAILGFAQLMESDIPPPSPTQKESLSQILISGRYLLKLINDILDLAKVESGKVPMSREPVSLSETILECQSMIEPQAQRHNITMVFPKIEDSIFIHADKTRIKQVILNLLSNAIKYNHEGGTVELACSKGKAPDIIHVSISDTGEGISPEHMKNLFQPFNRLGREDSGIEGTGIGLVLAKKLIEQMGGEIGAESQPGSGSTFWFEICKVLEPTLSQAGNDITPTPPGALLDETKTYTLLYVENNAANQHLIEQLISRHPNLHMISALNGALGIQLAQERHPDVILMDINLPDINGLDVLKILHDNPETKNIPTIAISANAMPSDIEDALNAGFSHYLTKPIRIVELMKALETSLSPPDIPSKRKNRERHIP
ncbi:MAG TPA: hybrid sensor histidine kinase/response regulator [Rhodospirillaceae bacterium]|nr:MAG: hypothetical protein A2018_03500 [Alphaproteobacteria bacterium GWF2_58_20]HAU29633.1 hybrid sensor histidine kinase/response regulator [Rhodospirillaceae bacterium]